VTEWPVTIDRRYHAAVFLHLGSAIPDKTDAHIVDAAVPLLRRLQDVGDAVISNLAAISVRSGDPAMSTIADALQVYSQFPIEGCK
jgi:hypothetical protein